MASQDSRPAPTAFGRYVDPVLLGQGGMGAVYRATDPMLDRFVAVKVLTHREPKYLERFRREAQVLAKIMHPSIIQIYEIVGSDTDSSDPYIVMEYFEGKPLDAILKMGPMHDKALVSVLRQAAEGLQRAHGSNVIHRDIKPANIMMAANGDVKILDFGIAKALDAKKDLTGQTVLGTPYYMSPEQAMGQPIDARTDLYSLGITAFHLLAGRRPFEAKSKVDVMLMQVKQPLPDLRPLAPGCDERVIKLIEKMCAKQPGQRFQNCQELIDAIDELPKSLGGGAQEDRKPSASASKPPPPPPPTGSERPVLEAGRGSSEIGVSYRPVPRTPTLPPPRTPLPPQQPPVRAVPPTFNTPGNRTPRTPGSTPARQSNQGARQLPPQPVPRPSRSWVGVLVGGLIGVAVVGGSAAFFIRSKDAKAPFRVPAKGWIYPGAPAPPLKKVHSQGNFGNCIFSTRPLEAGKEDSNSVRTSFATQEAIHGRCYFAHQVGVSKAGEVWQELYIDGRKVAQIIYDPPLPNDETQVGLPFSEQNQARLAELPAGKHTFDVWIYRQSEDAEAPEPLAAGEFTVRK
jgi:eukaryotic-like serine/threonine-protein kinase